MDTGKSLTLMFVGGILIYLSFYGLYVPGIYGWAGNKYVDTFDHFDTGFWEIYSKKQVSPYLQVGASGTLKFEFTAPPYEGGACYVRTLQTYDLSEGYIEVEMVPTSDEMLRAMMLAVEFYDSFGSLIGTYRIDVNAKDREVVAKYYPVGQSAEWIGARTFNGYSGKMKIAISGGTISFYVYNNLIASTSFILSTAQYAKPMIGIFFDTTYYGNAEFDNFAMQIAGSDNTPPPPPPGKGTLEVFCYVEGQLANPDGGVIYINNIAYKLASTGYWKGELDPGTYTVSAYYQGTKDSETVTVYSGEIAKVKLSWGTTPPPSPDPLSIINNLLSNPTVRSIMLIGGVTLCGIGLIGLISPRRPKHPATPSL